MGLMGSVFLIPIFAQTFLGLSATQSGYLFIPMAVAMVAASPIGGSLIGKVQPRYVIAASTFVAAVGIYLFSFIDPRSSALAIVIPLSVMAFGLGFGMAQRTNAIASSVPENEVGVASSILALVRNIAGAFGIAIFGTILTNVTNSNVMRIAHNSLINSANPADIKTGIGLIILKSQVSAYGTVFVLASVVVLIGTLLAFRIKVDHEKTGVMILD